MRKTITHILIVYFILIIGAFFNNPTLAQTPISTDSLILQLQQQVKALQEQLLKLQAEVSSTKTELEAVKTELKFTKILRLGVRNDEVRQLQEFLKQKFPEIYTGPITGYFGPLTESAIRKFQEKNSIDTVGIVGPKTLSKLNELITEGVGASGVVPPGLLIAPGIEKKIETITPNTITITPIATTSTPVVNPPVTPTQTQSTTAPTGICLIKDRYTDIPRFDIANFGSGFAKYAVSGVNTVDGLKTACTKTTYDYLLQNYCKTNSNPIQRLIMAYGASGIGDAGSLSCGPLGCGFIDCSSVASLATISTPTTTPSETIPAISAVPAIPATPTTSTTTVISATPATSATPAQPATTATNTTSTTDTTPPSVVLTGPSAGFANSNCTVQVGYSLSDNSGTVIHQEKINEVNYGSEISNTTVPNGPLGGGGCQNLANGTHTYTVVARDPTGNTTTKSITFSLPLTATVAPLAISSLSATNITSNSATITWITNQSAFSYVRYSTVPNYVYWDKSDSVLVTDHSMTLIGLNPATTYYYWVSSNNSGGNVNASMQTFTTSTASASDTTPATTTSSLDARVKNLSAISQMISSLNEILKQLSKLLK